MGGSIVAIALVFPLFLGTDLGLDAFGYAAVASEVVVIACTLLYLLQGSRRARYGLGSCLSGITMVDLYACLGSTGLLSIRSFIVETPYFLSSILAIRMSPVHGTVFQFLYLQTKLIDNIVSGFAMAMNFMGSRLWAGGYYGAFWILFLWFVIAMCTPLAIVFTSIAIAKGRGSLANDFAKEDEAADLDALMTTGVFVAYVLVIVARGYYNMFEQALVATQQLGQLAGTVTVSCLLFLACALTGYFSDNFTVLYLGTLVFYVCRIVGAALVLRKLGRVHGLEKFERFTRSDPEHALKLTIDDPAVAQVFGGKMVTTPAPPATA